MAISFLEFLYVLTRNSDNISKLSMIPLFSIHDPYISLGCLFRDCAQLALRAMLRVSLDFSSRYWLSAPCTMHHAPLCFCYPRNFSQWIARYTVCWCTIHLFLLENWLFTMIFYGFLIKIRFHLLILRNLCIFHYF